MAETNLFDVRKRSNDVQRLPEQIHNIGAPVPWPQPKRDGIREKKAPYQPKKNLAFCYKRAQKVNHTINNAKFLMNLMTLVSCQPVITGNEYGVVMTSEGYVQHRHLPPIG